MVKEVKDSATDKMSKALDFLRKDLSQLRTGRANIAFLDGITVDYYGVPTPISQVANVGAPEPRLLTIQPWDQSIISEIEKAIQKSDLGVNPNNDGTMIRLPFPQLTQETREEIAKTANKRGEESKVTIRNIRREANDQVKKMERDSDISEDISKTIQDDIQKLTDDMVAEIDKMVEDKVKDIMTI